LVESYIHGGGRIGVLVEVNCETDFVAKTDEFKTFVRDIAMQIAASKPDYVSKEEVPEEVVEKERGILRTQAINEGKPEKIVDKMVAGRIEKYFKDKQEIRQGFPTRHPLPEIMFYSTSCSPCLPSRTASAIFAVSRRTALIASSLPGIM
jgi:translation elongation factor EF-Ts